MRLPSTEQRDFVTSVEAIAEKHDPLSALRAGDPGPRVLDEMLWRRLVDVGVLEPLQDGDVQTTCLVAEALGRYATPVPYLARTVSRYALSVLEQTGVSEAYTFGFLGADGGFTAAPLEMRDARVSGTLPFVPDADVSSEVVALAVDDGETRAVVMDVADADVNALVCLDGTQPMSSVQFDAAPARVLASRDAALAEGLERVRHVGTAIHCASLVGAMSWLLDTTVDYAGQRVQFGQPIASRQAVKHACADMLARTESSRAMVLELAGVLQEGSSSAVSTELLVSTVKSFVSEAADECASRAFQLHGGIGFTWEHDLHHYFKRCTVGSTLFGTPAAHRTVVARCLRGELTPLN
ncbi:acyl-CoA/acyl-ACP dehydrogenase (plasmid) [Rhodococcus pyridinivorans]|uniref:acyl-CoA dehydrogenase family protein n=1 Tax=Rhodococcus TaxID=1827 RepID=UPI0007D8DD9D|nr:MULTISPECIES: acyl-CoA dehydrogenase family protein [Rhodococcus]MCT7293638.1 acyl-CoA/acyl-ACP dehydrogenase [Rhodococcus sp. PAE-6]QXU56421.1 acyl-CoA/acyl-ACP dehydrogenase [Rhodococcus sp. LW-XY12]UQB75790.1 acyl-CoA/acyl-ACP dehydrogenase [Rhodococcus ruber]UVT27684.1 acyl-CoA/acyl-ACP dehydrogenase [Rhodococcus pyridinivorans]WML66455.1 acyl-CoA dehydrogenase family protein [Rhodococcus sp. AH-ZY2]